MEAPGRDFAGTNIIFMAKVLTGLLLMLGEVNGWEQEEIYDALEKGEEKSC